mmetsp:Transcript_3504/g.4372  ORF Transcript_3504/g.4372 Transcript_3504/m.4372 type:complete len:188 (-) Transcript_3504:119-682(-)
MNVHLIGEINGVTGINMPNLSCFIKLVSDQSNNSHWIKNEGDSESFTQICSNRPIVWNHPIDLSFSTTSVVHWPCLYFEVWSQDEYGRNDIAGYGQCQVPAAPGYYDKIDAVIWRPLGTFLERLRAKFLGGYPQLVNPEEFVLNASRQREDFYTETMGSVVLSLNVVVQGAVGDKGVILKRDAKTTF